MSRMKTLAGVLVLAQTLVAQASDRPELSDTMAVCAGRMSAEMEFAWLLSDPKAQAFEDQRLRFLEILDALGPSPDPKLQLATRIDAKMAHAGLLTAAHFGTDEKRATWAKRHAVQHRQICQDMLLDS